MYSQLHARVEAELAAASDDPDGASDGAGRGVGRGRGGGGGYWASRASQAAADEQPLGPPPFELYGRSVAERAAAIVAQAEARQQVDQSAAGSGPRRVPAVEPALTQR